MHESAGKGRHVTHLAMRILGSQFPGLRQALPHISLTNLPSPLRPAPALAARIGLEKLWIKRDDLSADVYGGNKVRKLEYLLADAIRLGSDAVITFGAIGSNHALATSIYARCQGLECYAVLMDQKQTPSLGATLRYHAKIGTKLLFAESFAQSIKVGEDAVANHPTGGSRVYTIPWGGSSWLGTVGFIDAALEFAGQCRGDEIPEKIYVACGTWGTAAGLALGLRLVQLPTQIVAVRVVPGRMNNHDKLIALFEESNRELHERDRSFPLFENALTNIEIREEFLGSGYAEPTPECLQAVELIGQTEGLKLDTTYTGKALGALIHDARETKSAGRQAVLWNTYNSRPYPSDLDEITLEDIPAAFHRYL
jgi:1-aminocyclopropane-1-carboxylate deaminase/D-cysteine desulfhydrase-like pyridoxal-dependent ACC family enzyme